MYHYSTSAVYVSVHRAIVTFPYNVLCTAEGGARAPRRPLGVHAVGGQCGLGRDWRGGPGGGFLRLRDGDRGHGGAGVEVRHRSAVQCSQSVQ